MSLFEDELFNYRHELILPQIEKHIKDLLKLAEYVEEELKNESLLNLIEYHFLCLQQAGRFYENLEIKYGERRGEVLYGQGALGIKDGLTIRGFEGREIWIKSEDS